MKYFTIKELEKSSTADAHGIQNIIPGDKILNFLYLIEKILDPIREEYGKPIKVNSGYRSPELNTLVKGVKNSAHLGNDNNAAADITGGSKEENKKIFEIAYNLDRDHKIFFDQLIIEQDFTWLHIGVKHKGVNRRQILNL